MSKYTTTKAILLSILLIISGCHSFWYVNGRAATDAVVGCKTHDGLKEIYPIVVSVSGINDGVMYLAKCNDGSEKQYDK